MEIGDKVEIRVYCTDDVQTAINVFHYQVDAKAGTGATVPQVLTGLALLVPTAMRNLLSSLARYAGMQGQVIWPVRQIEYTNTTGADVGTGGDDQLPTQTCGLSWKKGNSAGPRFRGRTYWPFPPAGASNSYGKPVAGYKTNMDTAMAIFMAPIAVGSGGNTNNLTPILWSRRDSTYTFITSHGHRNEFATQRRRGAFGRPNALPF